MARARIRTPKETFDEPWKQIVPALFEQFVAFFAPDVWADIDWERPPEFLDKELRRVAKGLSARRVTADFLVKVWLRSGGELWLLAHIELQAQRDEAFPQRMFRYNIRAYDLYGLPVYSLAILADNDANWRPSAFGYSLWQSRTGIEFPVVKLLDYAGNQDELETSDNPFAIAVLAHLKTLETRGDAEARLNWKVRLARQLFARKWRRREIEELLQFLDWIMSLPEQFEDQFEIEWTAIERENAMTQSMPPILRRAEDRGKLDGKRETLLRQIRAKFGPVSDELMNKIEGTTEVDRLDAALDAIVVAHSVSDLPISNS